MSTPRAGTAAFETPRRALATVVAVVFIDLLGFGIIIPILPFYVRSFGVSDVYIGLLAASYSLAQFVFAPILGRLSDERGRRPVLLLSIAGSAVAWTLFGVGGSILVLFASRILAGAMGGNIATAQAYVADVTPPEERASALGLIGASFGLGFVFGPALGGLFASEPVVSAARSVLPALVPATAFSLPSFAAAALSLLNLAFALVFLDEPNARRTGPTRRTSFVGQFETALRDARLRGLVVSFFVLSVAFSGVQVMFIPFAADAYGYTESQTAILLTYVGVFGAVNQGVVVGRLARRYGDTRLAIAGVVCLALALAAIPFAPELGRTLVPSLPDSALPRSLPVPAFFTPELLGLLVVLPVLSFGNGTLSVALTTLVSKETSDETQGSAFGVTQGAGSLGRTVGPPVMASGYVLARWSPFVAGATLLVPVLLILARRR
ncbi:MFS transporter [Haladaptatus salinisoli]|uniref:MFS transporter n=1 Tax=Haladaptatus salinisoli TaxID=2884876 RepID=UPI001D09BC1C|nr:MFS transporter [Haladaptatus salinisoli]